VTSTTRLYLVRHGEPDQAARGVCYGRTDVALSPAGRRQATALGRWLGPSSPDVIYSSPRTRATETAAAIASLAGRPVVVVPELDEIDFGRVEGLSYDEIASRRPGLYRRWMATPARVRFPGGEAFADVSARVVPWLADVRDRHEGGCVMAVTHGGPLRAAIASVLEMPPRAIFRLDAACGTATLIEWVGPTPIVRFHGHRPTTLASS
jgi:alpha-ribazole phosphatase